jgi:hypothetical protein
VGLTRHTTIRAAARVLPAALALSTLLAAGARAQGGSNQDPGEPYVVCEECWKEDAVPNPTPPPAGTYKAAETPIPTPDDSKEAHRGLKGQFVFLTDHMRSLVPLIRKLVEKPVLGMLKRISWVLASLILLFSFVRVLKENNGASSEFYWWVGRQMLWFNLLVVGPFVVTALFIVGQILTIPLEGVSADLQDSFDEKYQEFLDGHFILKDGKAVFVPPTEDGRPGILGILYDKESTVLDPEKSLDVSSWSMPKLFALLSFNRGLLEFFDFFLIFGGAFILIGLRLGSPVAIALGFDQKMAHQMTYPYAWGTAAFTLVFPLFRDIIRIVAYVIGNVGLSVYDGRPMYWMDERTGRILTSGAFEPSISIFIASFGMMVAALSMPMSCVLAYRFVRGQNFEGISGITGGWMASILGTGVELAGLRWGAAIQKQAEQTQIQGGYQSETTRASGQLEAANIGARARQISSTANIQGGLIAALAGIRGNQVTQQMIAAAGAQFGKDQTRAGVALSKSDVGVRRDQSVSELDLGMRRDLHSIAGHTSTDKKQAVGQSFGPVGLMVTSQAIGDRNKVDRFVTNTFVPKEMDIERAAAAGLQANQDTYGKAMEQAFDTQQASTVNAVNTGAAVASGGASRGAQVSVGGINQAYNLELKSNKVVYESTVGAAQISRDAGIEAANLRALNHVVTGFFRDVARRIDSGLKPSY